MRAVGMFGYMLKTKDLYLAAPEVFDFCLTQFQKYDPLTAMDNLLADLESGKSFPFASYPLNSTMTKNDKVSSFLGICKGIELLANVFEAVNNWAAALDKKLPLNNEKFALIVTDKWDAESFNNYEQTFRYLAMNRNFWFVILLVTKHGITEIPFFPPELYGFTRQTGGRN